MRDPDWTEDRRLLRTKRDPTTMTMLTLLTTEEMATRDQWATEGLLIQGTMTQSLMLKVLGEKLTTGKRLINQDTSTTTDLQDSDLTETLKLTSSLEGKLEPGPLQTCQLDLTVLDLA